MLACLDVIDPHVLAVKTNGTEVFHYIYSFALLNDRSRVVPNELCPYYINRIIMSIKEAIAVAFFAFVPRDMDRLKLLIWTLS